MSKKPVIVAMDLEGVLIPEIWIQVAEKTGIASLRLTTRDIADYDELMQHRLKILSRNKLTLPKIQRVINKMSPLPGAVAYLDWLRNRVQCLILSDTYYEFAAPLMKKLKFPILFCNSLQIQNNGQISNYFLRLKDGKRRTVAALKKLNFFVIAIGDSYNDTTMLAEADRGILFRPPLKVIREFPQYPVFTNYLALKNDLLKYV